MEINLLYMVEAEEDMNEEEKWRPILRITSAEGLYADLYGDDTIITKRVLQFVCGGRNNSNSIRNCLRLFRENARVARDRISKEMWEAVNETWLSLNERLRGTLSPEKASSLFVELRNAVARFNGLTINTMMRGEAYSFYQLGGCVERIDMTSRILDVKYHIILPDVAMVGSALDYYQWAALLKSLSGFEAFRRKYHAGFLPGDVVEFVILERDFPRSIIFSVDGMGKSLKTIGLDGKEQTAEAFDRIQQLLEGQSGETIFAVGLHEFLEDILERLAQWHSALAEEFFQ
jgi:uncharacterized alpha-E superfamily protein